MRKLLIGLLLVPMVALAQTQKVKTVTNEREFLDALESNTKVKIKDGITLNLTKVLKHEKFFQSMTNRAYCNDVGYERERGVELIANQEVFDGRQLVLIKMHNLTIAGGKKSQIVVEPRYANVLSFLDCSDIRLENLVIGHTEEGYCEGGVIFAENCENIDLVGCDLYGCGTYGLQAYRTSGISMQNSVIRDCSYGIMELFGCSYCSFKECDFIRNREFTMFSVDEGCSNVSFTDCRFAQNKGVLFSFGKTVKMDGCEIHHASEELSGTVQMIKYTGNKTHWYVDDEPLSDRKLNEKKEKVEKMSLKERVSAIAKMYAQAHEQAAQNGKDDTPRNDIELTANYMIPAIGQVSETTRFFYELQADGEEMVPFYQPYLITRKYNGAARNCYEEYVFDRNRRQLVFVFAQEKLFDDTVNEVRYYWGEDDKGEYGVVQQNVKGKAPISENIALRKSYDLVGVINAILNQDY